MQLATTLAIGFALGVRHATDADHLIAIGTLARREAGLRGALAQGLLWGLGHSATFVVSGAAIVLGHVVVSSRMSQAIELGVAAMLVALGFASMRRSRTMPRASGHVRPVAVGLVHGLAGSAGLALVSLSTIADKALAAFYLAVFGMGTLVGMMVITAAVVAPFAIAARRFDAVYRVAMRCAAVGSVAFGLYLGGRALLGGP